MAVEKKLNEEDSGKLAGIVKQLNELRAQYGQQAISLEEMKLRSEAELRGLRAQVQAKTQELQAFSQQLVQQYGIATAQGSWTLDVEHGVFIGPEER